jgi:hypothetical protein
MESLNININNLNPGIRYKIIKNNNDIYSGEFVRSYNVQNNNGKSEKMLVFKNPFDETNGYNQGQEYHILSSLIKKIFVPVASYKSVIPSDIGRNIVEYGGNRKTFKKKYKKNIKTKNKKNKNKRKTRSIRN